MAPTLNQLRVKMYTDGADKAQIVEMAKHAWIAGFTTNPSLLKKAGVTDYDRLRARSCRRRARPAHLVRGDLRRHSGDAGAGAADRDVGQERLRQAAGDDDASGEPLYDAVRTLSREGVKVNFTAIFTSEQVEKRRRGARRRCAGHASRCSPDGSPISASTTARSCGTPSRARAQTKNIEIIWASTREVFNVIEADEMGCHIITAPADVLKKLPAIGTKTGAELALGAVKAFRDDALAAGLTLAHLGQRPGRRIGHSRHL